MSEQPDIQKEVLKLVEFRTGMRKAAIEAEIERRHDLLKPVLDAMRSLDGLRVPDIGALHFRDMNGEWPLSGNWPCLFSHDNPLVQACGHIDVRQFDLAESDGEICARFRPCRNLPGGMRECSFTVPADKAADLIPFIIDIAAAMLTRRVAP